MRLTIITIDKAVYVDGDARFPLEWDGTPENVHALQWFESYGWIEYESSLPNEDINTLPDWANNAVEAWENAAPEEPVPEEPES